MPNILHTFLAAGFQQAKPILGESVTIGSVTGIAFVTPADEKLTMDLTGYLDELDFILVLSISEWVADMPEVKDTFTIYGATVSIRTVKTDQSSLVLGVKKISV